MKTFLFLLTIVLSNILVAQYDYSVSKKHPFGMPNPNAPEAIKDYQELIGICDCESFSRKADGEWADAVAMTWEFKYIMNGMAVQDQTLKADGKHSGSIRQFNADSASWFVHYYASSSNAPLLPAWKGKKRDKDIVLYREQNAPNGASRWLLPTYFFQHIQKRI